MSPPIARSYPALEITWQTRPADAELDRLLAALDSGALTAVAEIDDGWHAFFESAEARDAARSELAGQAEGLAIRGIDVRDAGWAERSQASLGPVRVGQLVVAPPWCAEDPLTSAPGVSHVVLIRPSMGFGTGHHASTRLCLSLLQTTGLHGASVVDVGTGSGVLALAAWRLGAAGVDAVDHDDQALESARENVALNGAGSGVRIVCADLADLPLPPARYDVALANLTGATLVRAAGRLAALIVPGGWLIAGGIEAAEEPDVAGRLSDAGWSPETRREEDGWVGLRLRRRPVTSPTASRAS